MSDPAAEKRPPSRDQTRPPSSITPRSTTDDSDEAERIITEVYLPNRLDLSGDTAPLRMELSGVRLGALTVGRLTYGRGLRQSTADATQVHVNIPLRGWATSRRGNGEAVTTGRGEGLVFSPGAPAELLWAPGCEQLCLMVPQARLEAELERLLGRLVRGPLVFDFAADLDTPLGRRWRTVLELVVHELGRPTDLSRNPLAGRHLESLVIDGLLLSQPHNNSDAVARTRPAGPGAAIRRAVELIEERPSEPWTTVRLAAEVHLSVRALQEGFRRDLAIPPMTYLRQVRLRLAREALQRADRNATTVRTVALELGILHLGRFAAAYRHAFGESPSDTLDRPI
ncbi:AraC family transcriptional regulator [Nocardioides sp. BP30]|uniref:AraC family transcriptional regulator n=1 Tax=Nocardioides sp. BP30 TaxID=3036374 RepID=UPI0024698492|nr:AraC family transcriptional regulator [Nocardioides sp. BP30]WGL51631.1 AraC family transcriptional regulator [Nocardioides sp. BP30]